MKQIINRYRHRGAHRTHRPGPRPWRPAVDPWWAHPVVPDHVPPC